ncbi:DoxX family protein [Synechococcus sp. CS-602]|uniref:DoxX family protein n=1 Tax=Synechococcaceae TaxID=1890426 RepID=UPI0008FF14DC|nr:MULTISPECIES: DoxX family protein [Synechococcaceae]MCT4365790.1 DoxX family protein [Candidatus Regnicoccus frigidus MAG-AL1]APD49067.1 hypothetical protein BM449_13490 [Synechococcus sp. SynAce01]MCT0201023.1 DoxX family protein [Synechococcus sp. CS-603]MCT0205554.1 DoxX family protein [Synechococcus sp. CS-602]MCT0246909.1 DoxX family protein [Synechococcus sp. CS-601]
MTTHRLVDAIGRVLIGLVFLHALLGKVTGFAGVSAAISAKGLPFAPLLLSLAMVLLAVGSLLLISGWHSRVGALLLLIFLIPTSLIFHGEVSDAGERIQLLKNMAIIGGLLLVANQPSGSRVINRGG